MIHSNEIKLLSEVYCNLSGQYTSLLESISEEELNTLPFVNSWSAAQVVNHITKANSNGFLFLEGKKPNRPYDERIEELKEVLLDFNIKMESPDFILPDEKRFSTQESILGIQTAFKQLASNLETTDLTEIIDTDSPLGIITKWEIANFIVYHSLRHLNQLENIIKNIKHVGK